MSDKLRIKIHDYDNTAILRELIDEFLSPEDYVLLPDDGFVKDRALHINLQGSQDKDEIKREIFDRLGEITGRYPDWGILTGVRPVKLAGERMEQGYSQQQVIDEMTGSYRLTEGKARLITDTYIRQRRVFGRAPANSAGIYIGIPFCPTRCVSCSFASIQVPEEEIGRYLPALYREIEYTGQRMKQYGLAAESLYFGGGTPTTLNAEQLRELLQRAWDAFGGTSLKEFTVEAGRPDTIDGEKLDVLKDAGVTRISINPQSMHQKTLDAIGRNHTPDDIRRAFREASERKFKVINADLIAGLPGETPEEFRQSLQSVLDMGANNVTVHTLAVKRASRLRDIDRDYHYKAADRVAAMLQSSRTILGSAGFVPYYLYRQKHMAGYFENTGWCRDNEDGTVTDGLYNVRIMDEHQTIIALGAGGISKRYYPENNLLIRCPNVTNYQEYIRRIDEMLERKENKLWR